MTEKLKIAIVSIVTGLVAALAAFGIDLSFLSAEVITGIAAAAAVVIGKLFAGKKETPETPKE